MRVEGVSGGRYVVLEEIGRGGMGRVQRAYDPKLQREVALKEVRRESLGPAGAKRLVAEARAMAKLSHPNVVAVYDVEALDHDEVMIVMEYVPGQSLTEWLQQPRSWASVVAYFRQAGRGLAAAHAAGLLHRDFKPDNVLVGGDGRVRVTDFGLAYEVSSDRTGDPPELGDTPEPIRDASSPSGARTATGAVVGTLPYLAPERLMGAPADATTDQFAYCISLWEALFGERPFKGRSVVELAFAMTKGPPKPPAAPRVPPPILAAIVRGLAKDPRERWPNLDALLDALAFDPARRRRRWLQAAAGVGALGVVGIGAQTWVAARAERCSETNAASHLQGVWDDDRRAEVHDAVLAIGATYATSVWTRAESALDDYAAAWTRMHVDACEATNVRAEQSAAVMDLRMACLHRARVDLDAVTRVLAGADAGTVEKTDALVASLRPLSRCADIDALQADVEPPLPEEAAKVEDLRARVALAKAERKAGHYDEARQAIDAARAMLADVSYGPVQAEVTIEHGTLLERMGEFEASRDALREGLRLALQWRQVDAMQEAAASLLFVVGGTLRRFDEALRYVELARGLAHGDPAREARVNANLAMLHEAQGKYDEAIAEQRLVIELLQSIEGRELDIATSRGNLANALRMRGKNSEAEQEYHRALDELEDVVGPEHPTVGNTRQNLAVALFGMGKYAEAEAEHRVGIAVLEQALGREHANVAASRINLANALHMQGKNAEAEAEIRHTIAVQERSVGAESHDVAMARNSLAAVLQAQGRHDEAEAEYRRALAIDEAALGADHPITAQFRHNFALALKNRGKNDEAEAELRRALVVMETSLGDDHPHVAATRTNIASLLFDRGAIAEARELAEKAWERAQRDDVPLDIRAPTAFVLAAATWSDDAADRRRAIELAERSLADYTKADDATAAKVRAWLDEHRME